MAEGNYVSYLRVSTTKQGKSGLGLEAQRQAVTNYLNGGHWNLLSEFVEVESGTSKGRDALSHRPKLVEALAYARRHKATLVIAKLDRLARDVHFVSGLLKERVTIKAADMPEADITMLQIYAVMAEAEARAVSLRTKAALAAAKARGIVLGKNGAKLALQRKAEARERLNPIADVLTDLKSRVLSLREMATELNGKGLLSPEGKPWQAANLSRALSRL